MSNSRLSDHKIFYFESFCLVGLPVALSINMNISIFKISTALVEPYNSVLHCHYSIEHCDVSFLVDNQVK
jgi:hypothetical protein